MGEIQRREERKQEHGLHNDAEAPVLSWSPQPAPKPKPCADDDDLGVQVFGSDPTNPAEPFQRRIRRATEGLIVTLNSESMGDAVAASTDLEVLFLAFMHPVVLQRLLSRDPLAEAKLLGQIRRKALLEKEGGPLGPEAIGDLLGIQRQSVDKRRKAGTLLAVPIGKRFLYPSWQVEENKTLNRLEDVLAALKGHDPWRKLSFFVNGNVRLEGKSPLDCLRSGQFEDAIRAAWSLGEHGAA